MGERTVTGNDGRVARTGDTGRPPSHTGPGQQRVQPPPGQAAGGAEQKISQRDQTLGGRAVKTLKKTFLGTPRLRQMAAAATVVSNFCSWISFTTTSWLIVDSESLRQDWGIWRRCSLSGGQISDCTSLDGVASAWFGTFQAFAMLGFLGVNIAVVVVILFLFVSTLKGNEEVRKAIIITSFAAAACYLISIVIFAVQSSELIPEYGPVYLPGSFGHSFGFAIVSLLLEAATGGLLIKDAKSQ